MADRLLTPAELAECAEMAQHAGWYSDDRGLLSIRLQRTLDSHAALLLAAVATCERDRDDDRGWFSHPNVTWAEYASDLREAGCVERADLIDLLLAGGHLPDNAGAHGEGVGGT